MKNPKGPKPDGMQRFQHQTGIMSDSTNPLHGAELAAQMLAQIDKLEQNIIGSYQQRFDDARTSINDLASYLYGDDMLLHFDDRTQANATSLLGIMKKLAKWVDSNYIDAQNKIDEKESS